MISILICLHNLYYHLNRCVFHTRAVTDSKIMCESLLFVNSRLCVCFFFRLFLSSVPMEIRYTLQLARWHIGCFENGESSVLNCGSPTAWCLLFISVDSSKANKQTNKKARLFCIVLSVEHCCGSTRQRAALPSSRRIDVFGCLFARIRTLLCANHAQATWSDLIRSIFNRAHTQKKNITLTDWQTR